MPDGVWDYKTDELEEYINANSGGEALVMIYFNYPYFNKKTEIIGNTAIVYAGVSIEKIPFIGSNEVINICNPSAEYKMELIKETPPEGWMLK